MSSQHKATTGVLSDGYVTTADGQTRVSSLKLGDSIVGYMGDGIVGAAKLRERKFSYVPRKRLMRVGVHRPYETVLTFSLNTQIAVYRTGSLAKAEFVNAFSLEAGYRVSTLETPEFGMSSAMLTCITNKVFMEQDPTTTIEIVELIFDYDFPFYYNKVLVAQR